MLRIVVPGLRGVSPKPELLHSVPTLEARYSATPSTASAAWSATAFGKNASTFAV